MGGITAVSGVRRQVRELVDGTLELKVHIDPRYRRAFLDLFPDIDMPIAIAPITPAAANSAARASEEAAQNVAAQERRDRPFPASHTPQRLSQYAALLCREPMFQVWCASQHPSRWVEAIKGRAPPLAPDELAESAAIVMRDILGIKSRAELDGEDGDLIAAFHREVREPYALWSAQREGRP